MRTGFLNLDGKKEKKLYQVVNSLATKRRKEEEEEGKDSNKN